MSELFDPLAFAHGPPMKNRFMLAPLTNKQSHRDGRISDDERNWLVMRARGGFGLTMTCAAHVSARGQGFEGQLGIFSDAHVEGLTRLAAEITAADSLAVAQLHHAGMRSPAELTGGQPLCPSDNERTGARAMTRAEVEGVIEDFIAAGERAQRCGFHGVEIHGAHGYLLAQFLSARVNQRTDDYGGPLENRARIVFDIIDGIRTRCGAEFNVGLRLSPERFGQKLAECLQLVQRLCDAGQVDYIDLSLWDVFKQPHEPEFGGRTLRSYFLDLDRRDTRLGVAGKIYSAEAARQCIAEGFDYVTIGRGAILHHDFPRQVQANAGFEMAELPVSRDYLRREGLGEAFIDYMASWDGFVADNAA